MIVNNIHFPDGIYHYRQHRKPDGTLGNRYDLERVEGKLYPFMFTTLKRCGTRVIYLGKHPKPKKGQPDYFLQTGKERDYNGKLKSLYLSGMYFPDIKTPSRGFGDLGRYREGVLLIEWEPSAGTLIIMVFDQVSKVHAKALFDTWVRGGIRESCLYNNVHLDTVSVTEQPKYHDR
ncbi:MAG: hypothetical protein ACOX0D_07095 [Sphaerochaeta sp.]|jgi:hypothetical protein|nr:hypothetical protein [Sphaerochaeta sp.]